MGVQQTGRLGKTYPVWKLSNGIFFRYSKFRVATHGAKTRDNAFSDLDPSNIRADGGNSARHFSPGDIWQISFELVLILQHESVGKRNWRSLNFYQHLPWTGCWISYFIYN